MGHFAEAIEAGLVDAAKVTQLDTTQIDEINGALDDNNVLETGKLKPAFDALDAKYDYGTLKCILATKT